MKKNFFNSNRRLFVGGGVAVAAASLYMAAVGRGALRACGFHEDEASLAVDLLSLVRIGNSYLNELAKSGELGITDAAFLDECEMLSAGGVDAVQRCLLAVGRQAHEEYARSETVTCDGWVLAKSEARLCAMIAVSVRMPHAEM